MEESITEGMEESKISSDTIVWMVKGNSMVRLMFPIIVLMRTLAFSIPKRIRVLLIRKARKSDKHSMTSKLIVF